MSDVPNIGRVIIALGMCSERDAALRTRKDGFNCTICPYYKECDNAGSMDGEKLKIDAAKLLVQYGKLSQTLAKINKIFDLNDLLQLSRDVESGLTKVITVRDKMTSNVTIMIKR